MAALIFIHHLNYILSTSMWTFKLHPQKPPWFWEYITSLLLQPIRLLALRQHLISHINFWLLYLLNHRCVSNLHQPRTVLYGHLKHRSHCLETSSRHISLCLFLFCWCIILLLDLHYSWLSCHLWKLMELQCMWL